MTEYGSRSVSSSRKLYRAYAAWAKPRDLSLSSSESRRQKPLEATPEQTAHHLGHCRFIDVVVPEHFPHL